MWLGLAAASADGIALTSIVATAQQGYLYGFSYAWLVLLSLIICGPVIGVIGFGIKRYRATGVQTLPQYYEMRYSRGVRILAGIAIVIGGVLNLAIFPIIAAEFLSTFLGLPAEISFASATIPMSHLIMFIIIALSLFFVFTGGFVSVVITNYIQAVILALAIFIITYLCLVSFPGNSFREMLASMHRTLTDKIGEAAFNPFSKGGYGIVWILFFVASNIYGTLSFPPSLAMTSGAKTPEVARKMYLIRLLVLNNRVLFIVFWGVGALAVMGTASSLGIDPVVYDRIVTPLYLKQLVPPIILGIALTGFIFAEISTISAYILSWSTIIVNDVVCSIKKEHFSQKAHILALRITFVAVSVFLFWWGTYFKLTETVLTYQYLTGAIFTGAGIISFYGLYWKRTSSLAAYFVLAICLIVPLADLLLKQHWSNISFLADWCEKYPLKGEQSGLLAIILAMAAIHIISPFCRKPTGFVDYGKVLKEKFE
jgi:SSS family solute:Na+ symporter